MPNIQGIGGAGPITKADIRELWDALDLEVPGKAALQGLYQPDLVWQVYNPYPTMQGEGLDYFGRVHRRRCAGRRAGPSAQ